MSDSYDPRPHPYTRELFELTSSTETLATRLTIGAATTGITISGATTTAIDISGATTTGLSLSGASTTGLSITGTTSTALSVTGATLSRILDAGTSSSPLVCDTSNTKFISIYTDCGASAGDNRGIYNRLYLTSTGGGESLRSYTDISGTVGTAHGCHVSLGFGESTTTGAVTGLGVAGRFTLGLADIAYPATGTLGVIDAEIYSFGDNSDPAGNAIAIMRIGNNGNANGQADVDDDAVCFAFDGWTSATGNMVIKAASPGAMGNAAWSVRCKMPDGSLAYLNFTADAVTA